MANLIVPHDPTWNTAFEIEARSISSSVGEREIKLHHIGSTAIIGILAKPIIDILGIVGRFDDLDTQTEILEAIGYQAMGEYGIKDRRYFRKSDANGQRTHHLHVYKDGSAHIERHLAFRDYLNSHPDIAAKYSSLKRSLTGGKRPSRESYVDGKAPFIASVEKDAVRWYRQNRLD